MAAEDSLVQFSSCVSVCLGVGRHQNLTRMILQVLQPKRQTGMLLIISGWFSLLFCSPADLLFHSMPTALVPGGGLTENIGLALVGERNKCKMRCVCLLVAKFWKLFIKLLFFHTNTVDAIKLDVYHPQHLHLLWYLTYFKF